MRRITQRPSVLTINPVNAIAASFLTAARHRDILYKGYSTMQIEIPDETVRDVQDMLAKRGEDGDVSQYIDRTLQRALFFETVREVKRQNAGIDPDELDRRIDEAVEAVRTERK
jgi:hypothetical protein